MISPPTAAASSEATSEAILLRSMRRNIVAGALGMFWMVAAYGMPLPLLMREIHASGFQLGILAAVRQLAMMAQIPSAFLVERLGHRKPFWAVTIILHRMLWATPGLLPWLWPQGAAHWPLVLIVALGLSDLLANAGTAPWLSWMADLLPPGRAGRFWGTRQRVQSAVVMMAALTWGWLLDGLHPPAHPLLGFSIVFIAAATLGVIDIFIHLGVHEPPPIRSAPHATPLHRLLAPLRDRDFRQLTLGMGAWSAALALPGFFNGTPGFFNVVYLQENFDASYSQASWLVLASALGTVLGAARLGRAIDRFGARKVACFLVTAGPLFTLGWLFVSPQKWSLPVLGLVPQPVLLMSVASLFIGGFYAGVLLCQMRLTQAHSSSAGRTVAMAVHWSFVGVIGALGALAGGWIKDHFPREWSALMLPGGAPFSYFQVIILLQVLIAWTLALPLLRSISEPPAVVEK